MPINRPMIVNPQRPKRVITPEGDTLTLRTCAKCDEEFFEKEDRKETRCPDCRTKKKNAGQG